MSDTSSNETTHKSLGAYEVFPDLRVLSTVSDGASAIAILLDTTHELITEGSKLLSLSNQGNEYFNVRQGTDLFGIDNSALVELKEIDGSLGLQISSQNGAVSFFGRPAAQIYYGTSNDYTGSATDAEVWFQADSRTAPLVPYAQIGVADYTLGTGAAVSAFGSADPRIDMAMLSVWSLRGTTDIISATSGITDGASAIGLVLDTANALNTSGAKLLSVQNFMVEKFAVDKDGNLTMAGTVDGLDIALHDHNLNGSSGAVLPDDYRQHWIYSEKDADDGSAAAVMLEKSAGVIFGEGKVDRVWFTPNASLTANDNDYATINVYWEPGHTLIATVTTRTILGGGGSGDWDPFTYVDVPVSANSAVDGGVLGWEITKTNSGVVVPSGVLGIKFIRQSLPH